jgi:hypothetical protein
VPPYLESDGRSAVEDVHDCVTVGPQGGEQAGRRRDAKSWDLIEPLPGGDIVAIESAEPPRKHERFAPPLCLPVGEVYREVDIPSLPLEVADCQQEVLEGLRLTSSLGVKAVEKSARQYTDVPPSSQPVVAADSPFALGFTPESFNLPDIDCYPILIGSRAEGQSRWLTEIICGHIDVHESLLCLRRLPHRSRSVAVDCVWWQGIAPHALGRSQAVIRNPAGPAAASTGATL